MAEDWLTVDMRRRRDDRDELVAELAATMADRRANEWRKDAACRGMSVDPAGMRMWHPERGESTMPAKRICWEQCSVRQQCLEDALATGEKFGIRGGLSERERRLIRRRRRERAA